MAPRRSRIMWTHVPRRPRRGPAHAVLTGRRLRLQDHPGRARGDGRGPGRPGKRRLR
jgi:hypothetical protein